VKLEPWGEVTGRVVDDAGRPVKDAFQTAQTHAACYTDLDQGASPLCPPNAHIPVAADGRFRLQGLAPGLKYRFWVFTTKRFQPDAKVELEVVVKPGETKDLGDIRLKPSPAAGGE